MEERLIESFLGVRDTPFFSHVRTQTNLVNDKCFDVANVNQGLISQHHFNDN